MLCESIYRNLQKRDNEPIVAESRSMVAWAGKGGSSLEEGTRREPREMEMSSFLI